MVNQLEQCEQLMGEFSVSDAGNDDGPLEATENDADFEPDIDSQKQEKSDSRVYYNTMEIPNIALASMKRHAGLRERAGLQQQHG